MSELSAGVGRLALANAAFQAPRLAPHPVHIDAVSVEGQGTLRAIPPTLTVEDSRLRSGSAELQLSGKIGKKQSAVWIETQGGVGAGAVQ